MHSELIDRVAFVGVPSDHRLTGVVVRFHGLGHMAMQSAPDEEEQRWMAAGAAVIVPYYDPWGWMNPRVQAFVDDLIGSVRHRHHLDPMLPLIVVGGSMGGHAALTYALFARHRVHACLAQWPVCDLPFHYAERGDLPRTMHHAFGSYGDITAVLRAHSPLHEIDRMPHIPYLLVHGDQDQAVSKRAHSDAFVEKGRKRGLMIEYRECQGMGHGSPMDAGTAERMRAFVLEHLRKKKEL